MTQGTMLAICHDGRVIPIPGGAYLHNLPVNAPVDTLSLTAAMLSEPVPGAVVVHLAPGAETSSVAQRYFAGLPERSRPHTIIRPAPAVLEQLTTALDDAQADEALRELEDLVDLYGLPLDLPLEPALRRSPRAVAVHPDGTLDKVWAGARSTRLLSRSALDALPEPVSDRTVEALLDAPVGRHQPGMLPTTRPQPALQPTTDPATTGPATTDPATTVADAIATVQRRLSGADLHDRLDALDTLLNTLRPILRQHEDDLTRHTTAHTAATGEVTRLQTEVEGLAGRLETAEERFTQTRDTADRAGTAVADAIAAHDRMTEHQQLLTDRRDQLRLDLQHAPQDHPGRPWLLEQLRHANGDISAHHDQMRTQSETVRTLIQDRTAQRGRVGEAQRTLTGLQGEQQTAQDQLTRARGDQRTAGTARDTAAAAVDTVRPQVRYFEAQAADWAALGLIDATIRMERLRASEHDGSPALRRIHDAQQRMAEIAGRGQADSLTADDLGHVAYTRYLHDARQNFPEPDQDAIEDRIRRLDQVANRNLTDAQVDDLVTYEARHVGFRALRDVFDTARDGADQSRQAALDQAAAAPHRISQLAARYVTPGQGETLDDVLDDLGRTAALDEGMAAFVEDIEAPHEPWFTRERHLLGDGFVKQVNAFDGVVPPTALPDLNGLQAWLVQTLRTTDPNAWQKLVQVGAARDFGDTFVRVYAKLGTMRYQKPAPKADAEVSAYKSKYGDTTYLRSTGGTKGWTVAGPLSALWHTASEVLNQVIGPILRLSIDGERTWGQAVGEEIQSGNRALANDVHEFAADATVVLEVDGEQVGTHRLPEHLVLALPQVFATADDARDTTAVGAPTPVTRPSALHAEDYLVNAADFDGLVNRLQRQLRTDLKLSRAQAAKVAHEFREEMFNEKAGKDRNQWWTSDSWVSPFVSLKMGRKTFQGHLSAGGRLTELRRVTVANPTNIRNDIAATHTRRTKTGFGSGAGFRLGAEVPIHKSGQIVLPRFDLLSLHRHTGTDRATAVQSQAKTAMMHKDALVRYRATVDLTVTLQSNLGPLNVTEQLVSEFALPESRAAEFEVRATADPVLAEVFGYPKGPRVRSAWNPVRWYKSARNPRGHIGAALRRPFVTRQPRPFTTKGVRGHADLSTIARRNRIELSTTDGTLPAAWQWAAGNPRITVRTEADFTHVTVTNQKPPLFRYRIGPDGRVEGAWRLGVPVPVVTDDGQSIWVRRPVGYHANPALRRTPRNTPPRRLSPVQSQLLPRPGDITREPAVLANRAGLGPGVVKELPGAEKVLPVVFAVVEHAMRSVGVVPKPAEAQRLARELAMTFGVPGLRGRQRTLFDGSVTHTVTFGGHTFRTNLVGILNELLQHEVETDVALDVQGKGMAEFGTHRGQSRGVGTGFDFAARLLLGDFFGLHLSFLNIGYDYDTEHALSLDNAFKEYRRRKTGGDVTRFTYSTPYQLSITATAKDGTVTTALYREFHGPEFTTPVRVAMEDLGPPDVIARLIPVSDALTAATDAEHRQIRDWLTGLNPAGTRVSGIDEGVNGMYVWLNRVRQLADAASSFITRHGGRAIAASSDISDVLSGVAHAGSRQFIDPASSVTLTPTFLESHLPELVSRTGYALPMEDQDGWTRMLRVHLVAFNARYDKATEGAQHEQYVEADNRVVESGRHTHTVHGEAGLEALGVFANPNQATNPEPDQHGTSAARQGNYIGFGVNYEASTDWGHEQNRMVGGLELNLASYTGRGYTHTADAVYRLTYERYKKGQTPRRDVTFVKILDGMNTSTPAVLAQELGLPIPDADRLAAPAPTLPRVPIHRELAYAASHLERIDAYNVLPRILTGLRDLKVDVNDPDIVRSVEAMFRNGAVRATYGTVRKDGVYQLIAVRTRSGGVRLVGIRLTATDRPLQYVRPRPDAKVTTGGQAFQQERETQLRGRGSKVIVHGDGRGAFADGMRIAANVEGVVEHHQTEKHIETTTDRDIRRSATRQPGSEEFRADVAYTVEFFQSTRPMELFAMIGDFAAGIVSVVDSLANGRLRGMWQTFFDQTSKPVDKKKIAGSVRVLTPTHLTTRAGRQRMDLPRMPGDADTHAPAWPPATITAFDGTMPHGGPSNLRAAIAFSTAVAPHVQILDAFHVENFARWLPTVTLSGAHRLPTGTIPAVRHYEAASPAAGSLGLSLNRSNVRSNAPLLLAGEYEVAGHGETFTTQLALSHGRWLARGGWDALNFPEHSKEAEFERETRSGTRWQPPEVELGHDLGDNRITGGGGLDISRTRDGTAANSAGDYVEHNQMRSGDFDFYWFDATLLGFSPSGHSWVRNDIPFGVLGMIPAAKNDELRAAHPGMLQAPTLERYADATSAAITQDQPLDALRVSQRLVTESPASAGTRDYPRLRDFIQHVEGASTGVDCLVIAYGAYQALYGRLGNTVADADILENLTLDGIVRAIGGTMTPVGDADALWQHLQANPGQAALVEAWPPRATQPHVFWVTADDNGVTHWVDGQTNGLLDQAADIGTMRQALRGTLPDRHAAFLRGTATRAMVVDAHGRSVAPTASTPSRSVNALIDGAVSRTRPGTLPALVQSTVVTDDPADIPQKLTDVADWMRSRVEGGKLPVPFFLDNAADEFASKIPFGIEIEFDLPPGVTVDDVLARIGQDLVDAGLSRSPVQESYHAKAPLSRDTDGWRFTHDPTVHGEIVSPVMTSNADTWRAVHTVMSILDTHGAVITTRTSNHVHVSTAGPPNTDRRLNALFNHFIEEITRIGGDPEADRHRGTLQAVPDWTVSAEHDPATTDPRDQPRTAALTLVDVDDTAQDHAQVRLFDGTRHAAIVQARVKLALGLTVAAIRGTTAPPATATTFAGRITQAPRTGGWRITDFASTDEVNRLSDLLETAFTRPVDMLQATTLFHLNTWSPYQASLHTPGPPADTGPVPAPSEFAVELARLARHHDLPYPRAVTLRTADPADVYTTLAARAGDDRRTLRQLYLAEVRSPSLLTDGDLINLMDGIAAKMIPVPPASRARWLESTMEANRAARSALGNLTAAEWTASPPSPSYTRTPVPAIGWPTGTPTPATVTPALDGMLGGIFGDTPAIPLVNPPAGTAWNGRVLPIGTFARAAAAHLSALVDLSATMTRPVIAVHSTDLEPLRTALQRFARVGVRPVVFVWHAPATALTPILDDFTPVVVERSFGGLHDAWTVRGQQVKEPVPNENLLTTADEVTTEPTGRTPPPALAGFLERNTWHGRETYLRDNLDAMLAPDVTDALAHPPLWEDLPTLKATGVILDLLRASGGVLQDPSAPRIGVDTSVPVHRMQPPLHIEGPLHESFAFDYLTPAPDRATRKPWDDRLLQLYTMDKLTGPQMTAMAEANGDGRPGRANAVVFTSIDQVLSMSPQTAAMPVADNTLFTGLSQDVIYCQVTPTDRMYWIDRFDDLRDQIRDAGMVHHSQLLDLLLSALSDCV